MFKILAVPLFSDNYSYIIKALTQKYLILIDPANPQVILDVTKRIYPGIAIKHILYTHKHWDHAGNAQKLIKSLNDPQLESYIGVKDIQHVPAVKNGIKHNDQINFGDFSMRVYSVPCHTRGHVIYHFLKKQIQKQKQHEKIDEKEMKTLEGKPIRQFNCSQCLFTGDTLFSGGVGKFFQGQAKQMVQNLQILHQKVDKNCPVFNGHQYTLGNLKWSSQVQTQNQYLQNYFKEIQNQQCTLPTTLERQSKINIFYRVVSGTPLLQKITKDRVELMALLREMKNNGKTVFQKSNL